MVFLQNISGCISTNTDQKAIEDIRMQFVSLQEKQNLVENQWQRKMGQMEEKLQNKIQELKEQISQLKKGGILIIKYMISGEALLW